MYPSAESACYIKDTRASDANKAPYCENSRSADDMPAASISALNWHDRCFNGIFNRSRSKTGKNNEHFHDGSTFWELAVGRRNLPIRNSKGLKGCSQLSPSPDLDVELLPSAFFFLHGLTACPTTRKLPTLQNQMRYRARAFAGLDVVATGNYPTRARAASVSMGSPTSLSTVVPSNAATCCLHRWSLERALRMNVCAALFSSWTTVARCGPSVA